MGTDSIPGVYNPQKQYGLKIRMVASCLQIKGIFMSGQTHQIFKFLTCLPIELNSIGLFCSILKMEQNGTGGTS
jgi:hypothetical protein